MAEVCFECEKSAANPQPPDFIELLMDVHTPFHNSPGKVLVTPGIASFQSTARQGQAAGAN